MRRGWKWRPDPLRRSRSRAQWEETRVLAAAPPFEVKPAPALTKPFLGLDDPRVTYVAWLEYGRVVATKGRL